MNSRRSPALRRDGAAAVASSAVVIQFRISVDSHHFTIMHPSDFPVRSQPVESAGFVAFLEGPAQGPDGVIYFSNITADELLRRDADGEVSVFRAPSGR